MAHWGKTAIVSGGWQPIETAPRKRGTRIIGWCVYPAGAEAREVKCFVPLNKPGSGPSWFYSGVSQHVTHWWNFGDGSPLPPPPEAG